MLLLHSGIDINSVNWYLYSILIRVGKGNKRGPDHLIISAIGNVNIIKY